MQNLLLECNILSKITELILEMKLISNVTFFGTVENYLRNLLKLFSKICNISFLLFAILPHQFDNQQEYEGIYESSTTQEGQSATIQKGSFYEKVLISINIVFTVLFTIECILKLLAFGLKV